MNEIKNAFFALCLVLIASGVIQMIVPKGSMEKPMQFLISAVILAVILSAFSSLEFNADFDISQSKEVETAFAKSADIQREKAAKRAMEELIIRVLGSSECEIVIETNKTPEGDIYFSNVTVILPEKDPAAERLLKEQLGKEIVVLGNEK